MSLKAFESKLNNLLILQCRFYTSKKISNQRNFFKKRNLLQFTDLVYGVDSMGLSGFTLRIKANIHE